MHLSATTRIVLGLCLLTLSVLVMARIIGLGPQEDRAVMEGRSHLCESMAVSGSVLVTNGNVKGLERSLAMVVSRHPDILSAAVRLDSGKILVEVGDHQTNWNTDGRPPTDTHMYVPILAGDKSWGTVEFRFRPLAPAGWFGFVHNRWFNFTAFTVALVWFPFYLFLRKALQHMDPSKVVPDRVRAALDSLAGGLLILDKKERIVLANQSFAKAIGHTPAKLQGVRASALPWAAGESGEAPGFPWQQALQDRQARMGAMLSMQLGGDEKRSYLVNSMPIQGTDGTHRGVLSSFEDVTQLERKKWELSQMLDVLKNSRDEVRRKNEELKVLATQDPLTGCMNRRSFFELFETHWKAAKQTNMPLSCLIMDVDHFKSVNDTYGHSVGDDVLREVSGALKRAVRGDDVLCRYGGEEFCVLLPRMDLYDASQAAERFRKIIESLVIGEPELSVTASFGVSGIVLGAKDPQEMLDQADKCLYVAKRNGRNQVVRWDHVPPDFELDDGESKAKSESPAAGGQSSQDLAAQIPALAQGQPDAEDSIPFQAVTALVSALAYRDAATAEHSRRVADLCVAAANGLMSASETYVLEIAALLHDIGKIGVPDSILLKPGRLTAEEWKLMSAQERVGVELISTTFQNEPLVRTIGCYRAHFGGRDDEPGLPVGDAIPLSARLLAIADAYDSMLTDRVYRKGRTQQEAFDELRRCAGTQFDPELVERFIKSVKANYQSRYAETTEVSTGTAIQIGSQIERLIHALDNQDLPGLAALAGRLSATATQQGSPRIADTAGALQGAACDMDLAETVRLTNELLELCRSAQRNWFKQPQPVNAS